MECTSDLTALRQLPEYAPMDTSYLVLAQNDIMSSCGTRSYFRDLVALDLSGNSLTNICSSFFNDLGNLKELNLANNKIKVIHPVIDQMRNLTTLTLTNNLLEELPESIQEMDSLKTVILLEISSDVTTIHPG